MNKKKITRVLVLFVQLKTQTFSFKHNQLVKKREAEYDVDLQLVKVGIYYFQCSKSDSKTTHTELYLLAVINQSK